MEDLRQFVEELFEDEMDFELSPNFIFQGNNRREAYDAHMAFEMGFDECFRHEDTFEEFCAELDKGYGNSGNIQIARLYEAPDGKIYYDNEYCG